MQPQTTIAKKNDPKKLDLESMRARDSQPVKGIFIFHELPGGNVSFPYRAYPGEDVQKYTLHDGEVYTIPLGVARHLNKNGWYPVHAYAKDEAGNPTMKIGQKVRRFSFQSLEFVDLEDISPVGSVLTAEKVIQ